MSMFRRVHRDAGQVTVQEAAARTGHRGSAEVAVDAVPLDTRESYACQAGHAPRLVHLPPSALGARAGLPLHARAWPLNGRAGTRSRQVAELLATRGAAAVDVIDAMRSWAKAGLAVVDARGENGTVA